MPEPYAAYATVLFLALLLNLGLAVHALFRKAPGRLPFSLLMLGAAFWSGMVLLALGSSTPTAAHFWFKLLYFAVSTMPACWLIFLLHYSGRQQLIASWRVVLLFLVPAATTTVIWRNDLAHLFWRYRFFPAGGVMDWELDFGPWYAVHSIYNYSIALCGLILCFDIAFRSYRIYRRQSLTLFFGALAPVLASLPMTLGLTRLSFAPFGFVAMGIAFSISLFRYRLLDLAPIGRDTLIESMPDAMLVLDRQNQAVDCNPAFTELIGMPEERIIGNQAAAVFRRWPRYTADYRDAEQVDDILEVDFKGTAKWYRLRITSLTGTKSGESLGRLIVLHDITDRHRAELARERLRAELDESIAQVKILSGLIPICSACKKIRDDAGYWHQVENYIRQHSEAEFSHGICPDCLPRLYPDLEKVKEANERKKNNPEP